MAMNRVQFQPGLSMPEFMAQYGTEEQCEDAMCASRWPEGYSCVRCGCSVNSSFRREGRLYFQCSACRYQCSPISRTVFGATATQWPQVMSSIWKANKLDSYMSGVGRNQLAALAELLIV